MDSSDRRIKTSGPWGPYFKAVVAAYSSTTDGKEVVKRKIVVAMPAFLGPALCGIVVKRFVIKWPAVVCGRGAI